MSLPLFQLAFGELLMFSLKHSANRWLIDSSSMPALGIEEQEWLSELWLPCARTMPLRHVGWVIPEGIHNQLIVIVLSMMAGGI